MAQDQHTEASETSPLLSGRSNFESSTAFLESGESVEGPLPCDNGSNGTGYGINHSYSASSDGDEEGDNALERQATTGSDRAEQFEGLPDTKKQLKYILPAIAIGIFLAAADQTLVASSAGKIGSDLKALNNTTWIATAYFLTLTSFQPLYGKLSDIFGRKSCLLSAYVIFSMGCLWSGLARNMNELIAARVISSRGFHAFTGIGGGGMTTVVSILMSDIVPLRERGTWQGIINIIFATGAGMGAPLGGILADSIGWRWSFIGQFPLCLIAFFSVVFALKLPKPDSAHWKTKIRRIDFLGAISLVAAVTMLLLGLDQGSNVSWSANITIACLALSVPLTGLFILIEQKVAVEPFAPGRVIFERSLFASYLCNFFALGGWFGVIFYVPLYYQAVMGLSATQAGIRLLPGIISGVSGSLLSGLIMQKTGKYYWLTVGAFILLTLAGVPILLFSGPVANSTLGISIGLVMGGLGNGIGVTTSLIALISNASPADQAIATACSYLFRSLGSVLGLSIQAAMFQGLLRKQLAARLDGEQDAVELADKVRESLDYVRELDPRLQVIVREAYGATTTSVFGLVIAMVAGAAVASFFVREKKLSK